MGSPGEAPVTGDDAALSAALARLGTTNSRLVRRSVPVPVVEDRMYPRLISAPAVPGDAAAFSGSRNGTWFAGTEYRYRAVVGVRPAC